MELRVTISVDMYRTDGSCTRLTESTNRGTGDNPRFEATEIHDAVTATALLIDRRTSFLPQS